MKLTRTKRGTMVHKPDCHYAYWGKPWGWAEDKNQYEVANTMARLGYQTCLACQPLPGTEIRRIRPGRL